MSSHFYVYICRCVDNTLYTGITTNLMRRILEHNGKGDAEKKGAKYTRMRRPVKLVYTQIYANRSEASKEEYRIKKLTKQQKETLIDSYEKDG